jgi:S1-C subfamily serine protease
VETGRKIDLFGVLAILLFGSVLGGAGVYYQMDDRVSALESQVENLDDQQNVVYINGTQDRSLTQIFDRVDQSVVSISSYGQTSSQGSGFVYSEKGHIVTNEHVIEGANTVLVSFTDGTTHEATVVGEDQYSDIAVLKVNKRGLEPLELADSSEVRVGQRAIAIGNPFGLRGSMTSGIISQTNRLLPTTGQFSIPGVLQTDAAINPGNSGGPLLNNQGKVIGVNTAIESRTGTFSGIGFAVPSNRVENVVQDIIQTGDFENPWIGVSGRDVTPEMAERMDLENATGFLVVDVVDGGPADKAGIQSGDRVETINGIETRLGGDVIVAINGEKVGGIRDVLNYLARKTEVGEKVEITVIRDGERRTIDLVLESRPGNQTS